MHRHNGHEIAPERAYNVHPADAIDREIREEIEDANERAQKLVRDARRDCIRILNASISHIESAGTRPGATKADVMVSLYQVAYGLGLNLCEGMTMTKRAESWGVERATISKGAVQFTSGNGLKPSYYMKKEEARGAYADARIGSIEGNQ